MSEYISRAPVATISISTRFLGDTRLSLHAFRVAAFVLGQDPEKPFVKVRLAAALGIGRSTLDRALTELTELGYRTSEGHITDQRVLVRDVDPGISAEKCPKSGRCLEPGHSGDEDVPSQDTPAAEAALAPEVHAGVPARSGAVNRNRATNRDKTEDITSGQEEKQPNKKNLSDAARTSPAETLSQPKKPKARYAYTEDFQLAWEGYGRRGSKSNAFVEWIEALKRESVETIMNGIIEYVEATTDPTYRKHMERWLKGDCWEETMPVKPKQSKVEQITEEMAKGDFRHVGNRDYIRDAVARMTPEEKIKYGVKE